MKRVYGVTTWQVKPGLEDEFVRRWETFADWCATTRLGRATLLRDLDRPGRFVSVGARIPTGPWKMPRDFRRQLAQLAELLEDLDAHALELVERH